MMAVILHNYIKIGSLVELKSDVHMGNETYTKGHRFIVYNSTHRGFDLIDEEGNKLCETLFIHNKLKLVEDNISEKDFISHSRIEEWGGKSICYIKKDGSAFVKLYQRDDEKDIAYITDLSVDISCRNQGLGNMLYKLCEDKAKQFKIKFIYLLVKKDTWMQDWYKRLGFIIHNKSNELEYLEYIWMKKEL